MIELPFDKDQVYRARKKAEELGHIYNSICKGKGNFAGYLGEIVVAKYIGGRIISCNKGKNKFKYDLTWKGRKVEIKTKRRTVDPLPHYDASIAETSTHQTPDIYGFVSITFSKKDKNKPLKVWLCGFIDPKTFYKKSTFWKRNQWDKSNGFRVKRDMYNLPYSELKDINFFSGKGKDILL